MIPSNSNLTDLSPTTHGPRGAVRHDLRPTAIACAVLFALTALVGLGGPAVAAASPFVIGAASESGDKVAAITLDNFRRRPVQIERSGSYVLSRDLLLDGEVAIEITASDVTLDLAGHAVVGSGDLDGVGISIAGATNVKVSGGNIRSQGIGVRVTDSTNVEIADLRIDADDAGGAPPAIEIGVLIVDSRGVVVRGNTITETFLGVFVRGANSSGNYITGNTITGGDNGELAICYNPAPGGTGGPSGDLIAGNLISRFRRGFSFSADSAGNVLQGNTFAYFDLGIVEATPQSNVIEGNVEIEIPR
ncbi:MAG: hypothetical protein DWQ36_06060 [Acidobacteria bacterium]|nr:MAG: hypothetical protein DWQ30_19065 [Acidobacteriota bacterium]REK09612.1 MAG: hypothetical protein DWQ36_06060 [Acidobacteriota bacterium]